MNVHAIVEPAGEAEFILVGEVIPVVGDFRAEVMADAGSAFIGDPDTVLDQIKRYYVECGGFGGLLIVAGKEWSTREKRDRSMELFMQHVAPQLTKFANERQEHEVEKVIA